MAGSGPLLCLFAKLLLPWCYGHYSRGKYRAASQYVKIQLHSFVDMQTLVQTQWLLYS